MTENKQNYIALHMQTSGNKFMPDVLQMLRNSGLSDICYAYKIRTKSEAKLIEKVNRKKEDKPTYSLEHITDVVGLRLVALFKAEMVDIFESVLSAITHTNGISPNPFLKMQPEEIIIYKGTNAFDDLPPRIKDAALRKCPNLQIIEKNSKEGYSSIHLVARLDICPESPPCANYKIPIEIQIRSVFEDAWGEIDHKYGYVVRSGKDIGRPISNPEFVLAHLKVLKRFSDACMEYADAIRAEAVGTPPSLTATRKVISVPSDNLILDRFRVLQVNESIIEKYCEARHLKDQAAELMDQDLAGGKQLYLNAAELFREHVGLLETDSSPGDKLVYYYLRMNEALCLMSTNERDQVVAAHGIYQNLENTYQEYPLLKMRYGQALGKLGYLEPAIEYIRAAGESAKGIASDFAGQRHDCWPDFLPYTDYDHILRTQPKLLGYHMWLKIRTLGTQEEQKYTLFMEAYEISRGGLLALEHTPKQELSLHNNLLYYALGALTRVNSGDTIYSTLMDYVVEHVKYIEFHASNPSLLSTPTIDTMMKAYSVMGQTKQATQYAQMLLNKCLDQPIIELDAKEVLKMVGIGHKIINGNAVGIID